MRRRASIRARVGASVLHAPCAFLRAQGSWSSLPRRSPIRMGFRGRPLGGTAGHPGASRPATDDGPGGDAYGRHSWGGGCGGAGVDRRGAGPDGHIDRACGSRGAKKGPSLGEMVLAVAIQRACAPGPKCDLADFLGDNVPRVSCLPDKAFSGQAFHRLAQQVTEEQLEAAQVALAGAAVRRFELSTDVLAFDTTNFDTHIATTTPGDLARRGHAKSKRSDLRVVGLGLLVSETGHVPLLYRTYPGNGSDQAVLESCLNGLSKLHDALDAGEGRDKPGARTLVRDGGAWSPQLELHLDTMGYYTLISLPLGHGASERALEHAAQPRAMKKLNGKLKDVRAARLRTKVGDLDRTLVVVESKELLAGRKRGIAVALAKAKIDFESLGNRQGQQQPAQRLAGADPQGARSRALRPASSSPTWVATGSADAEGACRRCPPKCPRSAPWPPCALH